MDIDEFAGLPEIFEHNPNPLTMDELFMSSSGVTSYNTITIDEPTIPVHRCDLRAIRYKLGQFLKKPIYKKPYTLFTTNEPNPGLLSCQIFSDLRSLLYMKEDALIFPSVVDAEIKALRYGLRLTML
jgi:hypothetical protein